MSRNLLVLMTLIGVAIAGLIVGRVFVSNSERTIVSESEDDRDILYWVAPMDPNYRRDEPGQSPMGMQLVPVYAGDVDDRRGFVKIDPTIVNNLGVRTEVAKIGPLSRRIETVGYVAYDEDTLLHVHTRVEGWIEKLVTKASGDRVREGQLLFEIYSPTLVNAQEEYLAALRSGNSGLMQASKSRLTALGVTGSDIQRLQKDRTVKQRVPVYAESDGVIAHLGVREGIFVTPSMEVMSVAKFNQVWVLAEVLERQAGWVEAGQNVEVNLNYLPGITLSGTVDYIYPELDPVTRTLKVRTRFENADESLRPNMYAEVLIFGASTGDIVHVPKQAVVRGGAVNRVVVDLGDGRYRSQPVTVGIESGDRVAIRKGISAGDRIVISAQFLIDSESNIASALNRMDGEIPEQGR